jgi:hypothetical protein
MRFFIPLQSHKGQGRCAQVDPCIVYYFTRYSYRALESKRREKRGINNKCYSRSIRGFRRVPGF